MHPLAEVSFGEWLKRRRRAMGLTQQQLAVQINYSTIALKKIEAEERRPSREIVKRLAEVLNIPMEERAAFLRFARGDWRSVPAEIKEDSPWHVSTNSPRSNLPASMSSLVGREQAITDIRNYLSREDIRLVTLIGPPGIGKTRLSIETALTELPTFPVGVFFVALAPLDDPSLIALTIVQALGFVEAKNIPARQQLMDGIDGKQMLIVLDNCEHLIEDIASLASDLLSACPRLKLVATSREALRVPGEWLYPVPPLDVPKGNLSILVQVASKFSALTLFAERARAVHSTFALNAENIQAVSSICAQLDGLPLAIELIAARMRLMSPAALLERWNAQFILSADGVRAVSTRQKTLNNAIAWSYNLLSAEEQKLFAYLSVFSGGFTLEAAEAICSSSITGKSVSDLIALLLDKSLLQRFPNEHGEPRFNMLVTIQEYAQERLREMGEEAEIRNWHLAYFLALAEQADQEIHGPDQIEWMDRLEIDHDNFRAALDWSFASGQIESYLRLLGALSWFRRLRGFMDEARAGFEKICTQPSIMSYPAAYAKVLNGMGQMIWLQGDYRYAQMLLEEGREIWQKLGADGERGLAKALDFLGMIQWSRGDNKQAQSFFEQGVELYRNCGDHWGLAEGSFHLGIVAPERNENTLAFSLFEQSMDLFHQLGDVWGKGRVSQHLGQLFLEQGNYEKARLYFEQHLRLDEGLHFKQGIVIALNNLGHLYRRRGDYDQAEYYYEKSLLMCQEYNLKIDSGLNLYALGMLALHRDNYLLARRFFTEYYNSSRGFAEKIATADFLNGSAAVSAGMNQPERAAKLYGAAQALFETTDYRIQPFDRAEFDRHIQIARHELGEARFEVLVEKGRTMTMEQAIDYALETSESL